MSIKSAGSNDQAAQPQKDDGNGQVASAEVGQLRGQGREDASVGERNGGSESSQGRGYQQGRNRRRWPQVPEVGQQGRVGYRHFWIRIGESGWQLAVTPVAFRSDGSQAKYAWGDGAMPTNWKPGDPLGWMEPRNPETPSEEQARDLLKLVRSGEKLDADDLYRLMQEACLEVLATPRHRLKRNAMNTLKTFASQLRQKEIDEDRKLTSKELREEAMIRRAAERKEREDKRERHKRRVESEKMFARGEAAKKPSIARSGKTPKWILPD